MTHAQTTLLVGASLLFAVGILSFVIVQLVRVGRVRQWARFAALGGIFVIWLAACALTTFVWLAMMVTHSHGPDEAARNLLYASGGFYMLGTIFAAIICALRPRQQDVESGKEVS